MQTEEVKVKKRPRISIDPMRKFEKVEITVNSPRQLKADIKTKLRNWIVMFSDTYFAGRIVTKEAVETINEARSYGIEIPENIKHIR
jgi:hypothetical protein